jgi:hypothetical protein
MRAAADKVAIQSPFDQPRSYAVAAIERFSACGSMVLTIFWCFFFALRAKKKHSKQ